jgi:hypothetical protein
MRTLSMLGRDAGLSRALLKLGGGGHEIYATS